MRRRGLVVLVLLVPVAVDVGGMSALGRSTEIIKTAWPREDVEFILVVATGVIERVCESLEQRSATIGVVAPPTLACCKGCEQQLLGMLKGGNLVTRQVFHNNGANSLYHQRGKSQAEPQGVGTGTVELLPGSHVASRMAEPGQGGPWLPLA